MSYKQRYNKENEERILELRPNIPRRSGIYIFYREEFGFKYAYVGQAVNLLKRTAEHLKISDNHINRSLKAYGLYNENNLTGYKLWFKEFPISELDEKEREYEHKTANLGYQLRNKTIGGQGVGKNNLDVGKSTKGYYDGLKQGYKNARRDVAKWMKHLTVRIKSDKPNKTQEKALNHLKEFFEEEKENG